MYLRGMRCKVDLFGLELCPMTGVLFVLLEHLIVFPGTVKMAHSVLSVLESRRLLFIHCLKKSRIRY
jgi:hypothetical protein